MTSEVRLFKVDPSNRKADAVTEVNFAEVGLRERRDIQEWIAANPSILGEDLKIIAKEFAGFDKTNERADLVAVDRDGKVVVIELKGMTRAPMSIGNLSSTPVIFRKLRQNPSYVCWLNIGTSPNRRL